MCKKRIELEKNESLSIYTTIATQYFTAILAINGNAGAIQNRSFFIAGYGKGGPSRTAIWNIPIFGDDYSCYEITIDPGSNKITVKNTHEQQAQATLVILNVRNNKTNELIFEKINVE